MAYTLDQFCADCREAIAADGGAGGRVVIRGKLAELLSEKAFVAKHCSPEAERGVHTLYEDPDHGFVVLAHIYEKGVVSPPHDHGPSWAIYGQAVAHTDMTIWQETASGDPIVEPKERYRLDPGMVGIFHPGQIHSIDFPDGARFIRVTGTDLNTVEQRRFNLRENAVDTTKPVPAPA